MAKKVRLFKLASEINIGREEIVNFLQNKGFDIQNKPTTSLNEEMLEAVYDKFKREIRAVEIQREKIQKHKSNKKKPAEKPTEEKTVEEPKEVPTFNLAEVEKVKEEEKDKSKVEISKSDIVDSDEKTEENQPIQEEEIISEEPKEEVISEDKKDDIAPEKTVEEPKEEVIEEVVSEDKKDDIAPEKTADEPKEEVIEEQPETTEDKEEEIGTSPHLKGLTVLGKIDMPQERRRRKPKKQEKQQKDKRTEQQPAQEKKKDKPAETKKFKEEEKKVIKEAPKAEVTKKVKSKKDEIEDNELPVKKKRFKHRSKKNKIKGENKLHELTDTKAEDEVIPKKDDKKTKKRKSIREQISEEDVDKAIRETLSGMSEHGSSGRAKARQKRKAEREEKELKKLEEQEAEATKLQLTEFVTTSDLANLMNKDSNEIIVKCMELGLMVTINQRLDKDTILLIADDYGYDVEFVDEKQVQFIDDDEDPEETLKPRSPIVTIMGHVDHGKTSLLDHIRKSNVVSGEAGGITQHIGAYRVNMEDDKFITFLDTPGHEAFTAMRARGAQVTDIVVLIVAADDSVMPQTIEAISHANAANVPIVVAINKIDKPDSNPDRIKQQLADHGVLVEDWGGKFQSVEISAKKGTNVDTLLEKILLEAELLELKANPDRNARGIVIESDMRKGLGSVATVIVQKGTLHVGDAFVSGIYHGRVRAMLDEKGSKVDDAQPSVPVMVMGYSGLPEAGDGFVITKNEQEARKIATERQQLKREQELRQVRHITLDEISAQIQIGGVKDLFLVIKGDVAGSVEALSDSLLKLSRDEVRVQILHKGVGSITESDVMLAAASGAVVIGFNVSPTANARKTAENEKVDIRIYNIIYDCINEVQLALEGLLTPEYKEEVSATVEIRKTFKISKIGVIAGCYVQSGKITRNDKVRVLQDGFKVFDGKISSLKRGKDDVKEVDKGFECGIQLDGFNDINEGDIIEAYQVKEIKRTFS